MYDAPSHEPTRLAQPKRDRVTPSENDPRAPIAEMMVARAARHLHGIPIRGQQYGELMETVRLSALDDSRPFSEYETLRPVRELEDRFVQTTYVVRNKTLLIARRSTIDHHTQAFKQMIESIPETITRVDPETSKFTDALSRAFVRGVNDLNLADACLVAGDLSRANSYVRSAFKSAMDANAGKAQLLARLDRLAERPDSIGEQAYALQLRVDEIDIQLGFLTNRAMELLDAITDAMRPAGN